MGAVRGARRADRRAARGPGRRRPRLVRPAADGPPARLAGGRPSRSRRSSRSTRRARAKARADADWDARGGEVVNAEIDATWAALPMAELRERFASVPGQLRGYLTVVPETRWLKHADHQRFFHDRDDGPLRGRTRPTSRRSSPQPAR